MRIAERLIRECSNITDAVELDQIEAHVIFAMDLYFSEMSAEETTRAIKTAIVELGL